MPNVKLQLIFPKVYNKTSKTQPVYAGALTKSSARTIIGLSRFWLLRHVVAEVEGDMNRIELVRQVIDEVLRQRPDSEERRCGFVHLYGVAQACALLALKRGLDAELCTVAGMLHDIWTYKTGEPKDHAVPGSTEAQKIMSDLGCFTEQEISAVGTAVLHHSNKDQVHGDLDELLKDADVLQHHLYNTAFEPHQYMRARLVQVLDEFGVKQTP
jgi:uncharacterized protein